MSDDQYLSLRQIVPTEMWEDYDLAIRQDLDHQLGFALIDWIRKNDGCITSRIEELVVVSTTIPGMTEIRLRMKVIPIGPLIPGEWYFHNGPLHGQMLPTDGGSFWRIPLAGEPMKITDHGHDVQPMLVAVYRRDRDIYRFEGYDR